MKTHNRKLQLLPPDDPPLTFPPPPPPLQQLYPNPPFDSAIAITVLILLTALFFLGFFSVYIRRFASSGEANPSTSFPYHHRWTHQTSRPPPGRSYPRNGYKGVDPELVSSLPVYSYYHGEAKQRVEECPICLGEFEEREAVKMIPYCRHVFHVVCIDTWLKNHVTCPVCRGTRLFGEMIGPEVAGGLSGSDTCTAEGEVGPAVGMRRSRSLSRVGGGTVALQRSPSW